MPRICDRSPCTGLMRALGHYVFGDIVDGKPEGFVLMASIDKKRTPIEIVYCPFCGTQMAQVNDIIVEQFMRPRRRRALKKPDNQLTKRRGAYPLSPSPSPRGTD